MGYGKLAKPQGIVEQVTPMEKGAGIRIDVDTSAQSYDMRAWLLGRDVAPVAVDANPDVVMVRIYAVGLKIWYQVAADSTVTLDKSYSSAEAAGAGAIVAESNKVGAPIESGSFVEFTINRLKHKYLHVQGDSGSGTMVVQVTSPVGG